jgi:predicted acyl esterase
MRILPYLVLLFLAPNILGQGNSLDSSWVLDNYTKMEKMIPMRDGVKLFTSIYVPKDASEKHPILMKRTPYSAKPYGAEYFDSGVTTCAITCAKAISWSFRTCVENS